MSNKIKREMDKINIPSELHDRARVGVERAKSEMSVSKSRYRNKLVYACGMIVAAIFLLIGSSFISPTMSEILAKVPLLNKIIQSEPIVKIVQQELSELGYDIQGVSDSAYPDKIIYVSIEGTDEYYDDVKNEIKEETEDILLANNYDAFSVEVKKFEERQRLENIDEETKQFMKESETLMNAIHSKMEEEDFTISTFGVTHNQYDHSIHVDVPDTETRTDELKQLINEVVDQHDFGEFEIKLNVYNQERRDLEMAISSKVIGPLHEALRAREEFHTKGMAYSFHPAPLQIVVKTTVKSTDKDADEIATKLEATVEEFLATEEIEQVMEDEPYKIIIRSSDQKQMN